MEQYQMMVTQKIKRIKEKRRQNPVARPSGVTIEIWESLLVRAGTQKP